MNTVASRQARVLLLVLAAAFPLRAVTPEQTEAVVAKTLTQRVQEFKQQDIEVLAGMAQAGTLPTVYPQEGVRVQALLFDAMATIDGLLALAKHNAKYKQILDQFLNTFAGVARQVPKMDRSEVQVLRDKTAASVTELGDAVVRGADRGVELANNLYLTMARTLQPQAFSSGGIFKTLARKWKGFTKTEKAAAILIPVAVASAAAVATYFGVKNHQDKKAEEAATLIQAGMRGYLVRGGGAEKIRQAVVARKAATLIQAGMRGHLVRGGGAERIRQAVVARKAATLVQAGIRGHLVRGGGAERIRQAAEAEQARQAAEAELKRKRDDAAVAVAQRVDSAEDSPVKVKRQMLFGNKVSPAGRRSNASDLEKQMRQLARDIQDGKDVGNNRASLAGLAAEVNKLGVEDTGFDLYVKICSEPGVGVDAKAALKQAARDAVQAPGGGPVA